MESFASPTPSLTSGTTGQSLAKSGPSGIDPSNNAAAAASADFQNFLKLLTAQLRNQDPLSPLDSTQFVAQLASFSTVEQLVGANARLDSLAAAISGAGLDSYAPLLGREVEAQGAPIWLGSSLADFRIEADPNADAVEAIVTNAAGGEVARIPVINSNERQTWNGATPSGTAPQGAYSMEIVYWRDGAELGRRSASGFGIVEEIRTDASGAQVYTAQGLFARAADISGIRR